MVATLEKSQQQTYTPEEYFAIEETAEFKNEYRQGQIIPMTGGTVTHNQISGNLYLALRLGLNGKNFNVFIGDVRLWIPDASVYTYPDVMVISDRVEYHNNRKDTIVNPQIIIEVLPRSSRRYDRGEQFDYYRTIPSFQEYILVEQSQTKIEQFVKTDRKRWLYREDDAEDTILSFETLQLEVPITEVYNKVELGEEEAASE
ncbi:Uma2 family endonuclease [Oscillatoria sp. FACHB-1406]|uniref:Uma2 family endonuclease n=1 Tax=Oscillatoria sp. FACHB-1406 TaxID=2692846 RepID=UPI00168891D9|nr:Uma2 family endonuclease [Oscillatoria sp. FACHB-1406]MBD2577026.1 Uma2 family endonuclease [Oscillatoria sp. FACHB-1406]